MRACRLPAVLCVCAPSLRGRLFYWSGHMIFYTADLHFGSERTLRRDARPFAHVREMDERLIENWNATVSADDTVYVVGDIGAHDAPIPARQLRCLKGRKHLVRGNHDMGLPGQEALFEFFETVTDLLEIDDGDAHVTLCHYPVVRLSGLMVHGHLHAVRGEGYRALCSLPRALNAGVDVNGYRPVGLSELIEHNRRFYGDPLRGAHGSQGARRGGWGPCFLPLPQRPNSGERT